MSPLQLISNWMSGGDLPEYIEKHSNADRPGLVGSSLLCLSLAYSRRQLSDVANGLCYLHSCNVIHGDLMGVRNCSKSRFTTVLTLSQPNILMDDSGHARIADFGLATVTKNLESIQSPTFQQGYTPRWTAPEVLSTGTPSKEADIFSFAMIMIEVRHGRSTVCRTFWPTVISHRCRYSLARFPSAMVQLLRLYMPQCKASVRHDRHIQPLRRNCGN